MDIKETILVIQKILNDLKDAFFRQDQRIKELEKRIMDLEENKADKSRIFQWKSTGRSK